MILHNYFRSSTSARVRAALNLKGLEYEYRSLALLENDHKSADYLAKNPAGLVPSLELPDGTIITQSLAIIEYLEEVHPNPSLLPNDAQGRARVRSLAHMIALEVHPLNNLRVLTHLTNHFNQDDAGKKAWFTHWVTETFSALEIALSSPETGKFCHGDTPGMADICLFAQMWNNKRFQVDTSPYPVIERIFENISGLEAFEKAAPPNQPDAF